MAFVAIREALEQLLDREVDFVDHIDVARNRNYIRRRAIVESAEVIYAA